MAENSLAGTPPPAGMEEAISGTPDQALQASAPTSTIESPLADTPPPAGMEDFVANGSLPDEYESEGTLKAFGEGAAQSATFGASNLAEQALGANPKDILAREEQHPIAHGLGAAAGILGSLATGQGEAAIISKIGSKIFPAAESLAAKMGAGAVRGAVENAIFSGGDEVSHMLNNDPHQTSDSALAHIGLGTALGGGLGGLGGAAGKLWDVKFGGRAGQTMADMADRVNMHIENPDLTASATKELTDLHKRVSSYGSELFGANGLKSEEIAKAVPQMNDLIAEQAADNYAKLIDKAQSLAKKGDNHSNLLFDQAERYGKALETNDSASVFNATQELKQNLAADAKFNSSIADPIQRTYRNAAKELASSLKDSLEDTNVWGKAGEIQKGVNTAFSRFLPALKDYEKSFTRDVLGSAETDPAKILTFANQAGKDNAAIKQKIVKNFLDRSAEYEDVVHGLHVNAGVESPVTKTSLNATNYLLNERTLGGKLADTMIKQGLSEGGSKAMGATIGGLMGHSIGMGEVGALVGSYALGPFIQKTLPLLIKPALKMAASGSGLRAGAELAASAINGDKLLTRAAKSIFKGVALPASQNASKAVLARLDKQLQEIQVDPSKLQNSGAKDVAHYLPDHSVAMSSSLQNAANLLNQMRPKNDKGAPLDLNRSPSSQEKAQYQQALTIANDPTSVLGNIAKGTITPQQIMILKSLYPAGYNSMVAKLSTELNEAVKNKTPIPYKIRQGLSMFMGQPLDSSLMPMNMFAAQAAQTGAKAASQQSQEQAPQKAKNGSAPLKNFSKPYRTPGQAAEEDQSKR